MLTFSELQQFPVFHYLSTTQVLPPVDPEVKSYTLMVWPACRISSLHLSSGSEVELFGRKIRKLQYRWCIPSPQVCVPGRNLTQPSAAPSISLIRISSVTELKGNGEIYRRRKWKAKAWHGLFLAQKYNDRWIWWLVRTSQPHSIPTSHSRVIL